MKRHGRRKQVGKSKCFDWKLLGERREGSPPGATRFTERPGRDGARAHSDGSSSSGSQRPCNSENLHQKSPAAAESARCRSTKSETSHSAGGGARWTGSGPSPPLPRLPAGDPLFCLLTFHKRSPESLLSFLSCCAKRHRGQTA